MATLSLSSGGPGYGSNAALGNLSVGGYGGSSRMLANIPHGVIAKNAAMAHTNALLNKDYDVNKLHPSYRGEKRLSAPVLSCGGVAPACGLAPNDIDPRRHSHCVHPEVYQTEWDSSESSSSDSDYTDDEDDTKPDSRWRRFRKWLKIFVDGKVFQRGILLAILVNTLSMGIEYHNQPETLTLILEYSNIFFCAVFAFEMLLKIVGYGPFGYVKNGFNVFDGFIVILSIVELIQGGEGGLSVLRTFRLLRILKLVRFLPALRYQLVIMLKTMDNVATFFALLILFIFIFSVLGMTLFGGKFCEHPDGTPCDCADLRNSTNTCHCDRKNFDTLLWSLVTVFQILTQEDWNEVLYNGMAKTSAWAALYFIALMTFGNYVLFNLLVAILVEGFSTEGDDKKNEEESDDEKEKEEELAALEGKREKDTNKQMMKTGQCKMAALNQEDVKNNKEKELKMKGLPPSIRVPKEDNTLISMPSIDNNPPPIITHTCATPMATPQGSPNEASSNNKDIKNNLTVARAFNMSSLSIDSIDKTSTTLSVRGTPKPSPRPSPRLQRKESGRSQRSWLAVFRNRDDNKSLVDSQSDSENDGDCAEECANNKKSPNNSRRSSVNNYSDCNGHAPLNNQRALSPQNSIKSYHTLSPCNSIKGRRSVSRHNSLTSNFSLSRQNSFTSNRTLSPQNSIGSGAEYKPNNLTGSPDHNKTSPDQDEDEDPDAIDETDCSCSWCPEPKGCFLTRAQWALYLLSPENKFRRLCQHLCSRKWFDYGVLFFIALNCITLAMERPDIPKDSAERQFLTMANYVFTFIFTLEMTVKVLAKGLLIGTHAYLKSGWNVMDGFLVFIALIDLSIALTASSSPRIFGILRVFRLLRTLRPLRVISRAPGLKLVVQTLLSSLRPIGNIVLICCTFFIIFGILGVQLFKGTFYHCDGPDVHDIKNKTDCLNKGYPYRWINRKYNFDNLGQALMALFVLASKDGWVQLMYTGLDAVAIDQQPIENFNEWRLIYFISFLLLVGFFVLNMFVGVVVENFHKCRESQEKEEKARRAAKRAKKMDKKRRKLREPPYWAEYSKTRLIIHTVCLSKYFDLAIAGVIGLNVITMAMEFYMMPASLQYALKIFNYFFTCVFILEAIVKVVALGVVRYFKDRWNQLDMGIVVLSIVGIVLEEMKSNVIPINPTIIRVMRVLRIARVLKLLKMAKGIRALLDTVMQALPQVGNLGLLFFLLFFIFAALGVELFGRLECSRDHPCEGLSKHAHFQNFGMAFLTLFRVATGDNWNGIMKDTLREDCDDSENCERNCCVSPIIAPVFFVVFVLMAQFVLVNVVVAVLMKHLEESNKAADDDRELELEIERELEEEMRNNAEMKYKEQQALLMKEKEDNADYKLEKNESFDGAPGVGGGTGLLQMVASPRLNENKSQQRPRATLSKQSSLPPDFKLTINVRPPSPDPHAKDLDSDPRISPTHVDVGFVGDADMAPPAIQEEDEGGVTMILPRHNGNIRAQPPRNLPISPSQGSSGSGVGGPRRTPSGRRGSFLARQNAIQTSSGSLSRQSSGGSSLSPSPSPACTPLPFSESSRTYRGSVPNIPGVAGSTGTPIMSSPGLTRPSRSHRPHSVAAHSQPSLDGSRSRSSSRSPLGSANSDSGHVIPRISPPPQPEPRRRGSRGPPSRSGSTSPNQLALPLQTMGGGRSSGGSPTGGYANTMFCPPSDGAPSPPYDDCVDPEEQNRITQDLAQDERLDEETPLNPEPASFTPEEELQCDAEVQKITGTTPGPSNHHSNHFSNDCDALLSQDSPRTMSPGNAALNNNNNNRKNSLNSTPDVDCAQYGCHGSNQDNNSHAHSNHLDNSPPPGEGCPSDCSTHTQRTPHHHGSANTTGCHGYKDDVIDDVTTQTSQGDATSSNCERRDSMAESLSEQVEHFV